MNLLLGFVALSTFVPCQEPVRTAGIRRPAISRDGRIAFATGGDVWVVVDRNRRPISSRARFGVTWVQVTRGPADDRDPAWTADGLALVFASDRSGSFDLYRVVVDGRQVGDAIRLTESAEPDAEPSVGPDDSIVFSRGRGAAANLILRRPDGAEEVLTDEEGAERSPAFAPDGASIAYVAVRGRGAELRIKQLGSGADGDRRARDRVVVSDVRAELPAWSPDGSRLAFTTRGQRAGVWLTDREGTYTNLVSRARAAAAFAPDGERLLLAALPRAEPGYNGDPDRVGERRYDALTQGDRALRFVPVPPPPDAGAEIVELRVPVDAAARVAALERVWGRLAAIYGGGREWDRLRERFVPRAREASDDRELEDAIYRMLRERPPLRREARGRAAVSSAHRLATAAGVEVLEAGGNVVDAAIAVSFATGVVEPDASGVGGYGEMLVYLAGMDEPACIEFMTRVPAAVAPADSSASAGPRRPGPQLVNVPGVVAGMELAFERFGSGALEWSALVEPAVRLAEEGFAVSDALATTLERNRARYLEHGAARELFCPDGEPRRAGDLLKNPGLAWTLRRIAEGGADAFYRGEVAERMIDDLRGHGSILTKRDLANYFAVERRPVAATYRGYTVYSGAPPVSGGASLIGKLTLLEQEPSLGSYLDDAATVHRLIEAWKLAPSTSGRIADPGLWPVDLAPFSDKEAASARWGEAFDANRSLTTEDIDRLRRKKVAAAGGVLDLGSSTGTTAFVVADRDGNMVAVTQTLGTWGGNFYVTEGLGFLYNDKLRPASRDPDRVGAVVPMARIGTVIAPTLLFEGAGERRRPFAALGAAGNSWITAAVYEIVSGLVDQGLGPQEAIELPRFLVGSRRRGAREIVIQLEDGFAPGVLDELRALGHEIQRISLRGELRMGYAAAAVIDDGEVRAGADPRRSGAAGAVR